MAIKNLSNIAYQPHQLYLSLVIKDIVKHFLSDQALSSLFIPQPMSTKERLKKNFTKLAHSSIMKLNHDAMDKVKVT